MRIKHTLLAAAAVAFGGLVMASPGQAAPFAVSTAAPAAAGQTAVQKAGFRGRRGFRRSRHFRRGRFGFRRFGGFRRSHLGYRRFHHRRRFHGFHRHKFGVRGIFARQRKFGP